MRYLAIARFRLLTTVRSASPIFAMVALPPLIAAATESVPEPLFRDEAAGLLGYNAHATLLAWGAHAFFIVMACQAFGNLKNLFSDPTAEVPDLMDSAPVGKGTRFWGEALGMFAAALTIHVASLPLLAAAALLSPLPFGWFAVFETVILALLVLASAAAAWKRLSPRNRWSATRTPRAAILFFILLAGAVFVSTDWPRLRDALASFVGTPSAAAWSAVTAAVHNPLLLALMAASLYAAYILFFFSAASRTADV